MKGNITNNEQVLDAYWKLVYVDGTAEWYGVRTINDHLKNILRLLLPGD